MDDPLLVGGVNRLGQRLDRLCGVEGRLRRMGQLLLQRFPGDEFQRQKRPAVKLADLVDLHDVGVVQRRHGLGFDAEPR